MSNYKFDDTIHLHLFNKDGEWKPLTGTSSVVGVIAKPLTWWASGLAVEKFGWLNPKKHTEEEVQKALTKGFKQVQKLSIKEYEKLLADAYKAHQTKLKDSAVKGTDLHSELERFVRSEMGKKKIEDKDFDPKIKPFIEWSRKNIKQYIASEAHCYDIDPDMFVGGITDAVAELHNGLMVVIDFKSAAAAYKSHAIQGAGYALQIDKNGLFSADGKHNKKLDKLISQIIIVPFGAEKVEPVVFTDIIAYKDAFKAAVVLYRLMENHED